MDVLYILGTGSRFNDKELRYSLRSLEAHYEFDRFYLVGECPEWCKPDTYIKAEDPYPIKSKNAYHKIKIGCQSDISDTFLLMNDDFIILKNQSEVPHYYNGTIQEELDKHAKRKSDYHKGMQRSRDLFPNGLNFEVHYPFPIHKDEWLKIMETYIHAITRGALIRNIYGNSTNRFDRKPVDRDCKIYKPLTEEQRIEQWFKRKFISLGDTSCTNKVFKRLKKEFPNKSTYEH